MCQNTNIHHRPVRVLLYHPNTAAVHVRSVDGFDYTSPCAAAALDGIDTNWTMCSGREIDGIYAGKPATAN